MTMTESRQDRRKRKYNLLKNAGFSSKDATKYKDYSNWIVIQLIELREELNDALDAEFLEFEDRKALILKQAKGKKDE